MKVILFADDSTAYTSSKTIESLTDVVNSDLKKLSECFKVNKLSLNVTKTNFRVIGKNRHINTVQIYINGKKMAKIQI